MKTKCENKTYLYEFDSYAELASYVLRVKPSQIHIAFIGDKVTASSPVAFRRIKENTIER